MGYGRATVLLDSATEGALFYKVEDKIVTVVVVRITPDHNYRK
jgi:hypothetical protein